jgi:two-component system CheB/CheR fusion protein
MVLEADHVYVIPPNAIVTVADSRLKLTPRIEVPRPFMPVDYLFRSLAKTMSRRAIGVILSGGGTDGVLGLQEIKEADGITFAQDQMSATHESMPRSAILSGCVDYVLPPDGIARELARIGRHRYLAEESDRRAGEPDNQQEVDEIQRVFGLVRAATGVDFSRYKRNTLLRRTRRRMGLRRVENLTDYVKLLEREPDEIGALYQDYLIRVTSFFRDSAAFDQLRDQVIPALLHDRLQEQPIRIWAVGCATGEEVYSIAISLIEALGERAYGTQIKIMATDVNERALEIARAGVYVENIAADVSPERLRHFFTRVDGRYQIGKNIRDMCMFSRHDITRDPPFARLDLITCRNLLIYLDLPIQRRVMPMFHYALRPGGCLMLGPSESIGTFSDLFTPMEPENKIFRRKDTATQPSFDFDMGSGAFSVPRPATPERERGGNGPFGLLLQREVDRVVLARLAPAGVVIDEEMRILQFRGRTDPYLAPAPGLASFDLLKMAREGLMVELRNSVNLARSRNQLVRCRALRIDKDGRNSPVEIQVVPLRVAPEGPRHFLILFEPSPTPTEPSGQGPDAPKPAELDESQARSQVLELRRELDAMHEYVQSVIEENEATTEELKSANEEILSSNEELQSTNEELQTAKEEMQSANEELSIVNQELKHRLLELGEANDDLINLFSSVQIPVLMVSRDLRIRRFTSPAERLLNLLASDIGRPISDLRTNLEFPGLDARITEVISTLTPEDHEVRGRDGLWYWVRIRPYITTENKIDGAVMAIVDIDQVKRTAENLKHARDRAEAIVDTVWQPLAVLDGDLRVMRANRAFHRLLGRAAARVDGRLLRELGPGPWADRELSDALRNIPGTGLPMPGREIETEFGPGGPRIVEIQASPIHWDDGGGVPMVLMAMEDVTDRKRELENRQQLLREQTARVEAERASRRKDEFLAMLSHELRNPLAPILNALLLLRASECEPADAEWAFRILERQVRHMSRLVDDLLDVSRVMRGNIEIRKERLVLADALKQAVEDVRSTVEGRRHRLSVELPDEPIVVDADPVRLEQVFVNLLNNASKYTPEGGRIAVIAAREGGQAVIRVSDNGIGIHPDHLPEIFDLFMQVDNSLERSTGGLGIGLTLVKSLVEQHGGTIEASSAGLGRGSEFIVRLPEAADDRTGWPPASSEESADPRRVLVVDDNHDAAVTLALLLRGLGHEVKTAFDGASAVATA